MVDFFFPNFLTAEQGHKQRQAIVSSSRKRTVPVYLTPSGMHGRLACVRG